MRVSSADLSLIVRRVIKAQPDRVFNAWTNASILQLWWGPKGITCPEAEIDLEIGGVYKISNRLPDGSIVWIKGQFEEIIKNQKLVYSWWSSEHQIQKERVTVWFKKDKHGTEVVVSHERIATQGSVEDHTHGWLGCLEGLVEYFN